MLFAKSNLLPKANIMHKVRITSKENITFRRAEHIIQKASFAKHKGAFCEGSSRLRAPPLPTGGSLTTCNLPNGILFLLHTLFYASNSSSAKENPSRCSTWIASGGDEGSRTPYLLNAIQTLYQMSYTPTA